MIWPNFIVIGAGKSGTTSLYNYLQEHPQIYMSPIKEPSFFAYEGEKVNFSGPGDEIANPKKITDIETYTALFKEVSTEKAIGEASPVYIYRPKASERIEHHIPDAKLIAILRDPVDRAFSDYLMYRECGRETLDFTQAILDEKAGRRENWGWGHYIGTGLYYTELKRYFDKFECNQLKVYLYEDLKSNPLDLMEDIYRFLGVDHTFLPDTERKHNVGGTPKNKALHSFLTAKNNPIKSFFKPLLPTKLRQQIIQSNIYRPKLSPEVRQELISLFREEILKLQELIQRDLSQWLE